MPGQDVLAAMPGQDVLAARIVEEERFGNGITIAMYDQAQPQPTLPIPLPRAGNTGADIDAHSRGVGLRARVVYPSGIPKLYRCSGFLCTNTIGRCFLLEQKPRVHNYLHLQNIAP
jgi:hypothetical protein